jgi:hypothetical protein
VRTKHGRLLAVAVTAVLAATGLSSAAAADDDSVTGRVVHVQLSGYQEDPQTISTPATGRFLAQIDSHDQTITYFLSYSGFESDVQQAHIHFGGRAQSGGVSVFLCSNLGNAPAGTPACPLRSGSVTGTLTPASVLGPAGQGIAAGEFDELVAAIRAGATYANVHSANRPAGEIRAQLVR